MYVTCGLPSERGVVETNEAVAPVPTTGLLSTESGGHAPAHAPVHALFVPRILLEQIQGATVRIDEDLAEVVVVLDADCRPTAPLWLSELVVVLKLLSLSSSPQALSASAGITATLTARVTTDRLRIMFEPLVRGTDRFDRVESTGVRPPAST